MSHLVSFSQISGNLRRTAESGLISLLNHQQLEDLAFKYFGIKDEYGNITGYQCPYSGKIYTDYQDIVLEHIVPVASKGGTVLFNCIPTSKEVNGADQKGAKHLIDWWTNPDNGYWDKDAPLRLEKIINYMLDGYEQVFKEYTIEEVESSYLDIETDEGILDEEEDKDINSRTESKLLKQAKNNGIHSYLGFIYDCINTLEKCNINTSSIKERLQQLQNQNIFKDIDRYQLYQNIIQKLVVSRIGDNNSSYLTYTLNYDIKKLMDSINLDNEQDIYNELNRRLQNTELLLKENNLSTIEYFKSLRDVQDIDILYKNINNISEQDKNIFLENIKIGIDTKIDIFVKMLNKGNDKILKKINTETLEGYPSIKLSYFWNSHQDRIKQKLFIELKDNPEYDVARKLIEIKEISLSVEKQISIFIDMLNKGNDKILKTENKETLEGYTSIKLSYFWQNNKDRIKQKLFIELKDNPEYDVARKLIEIKEISLSVEKQIPIFINMLNKGNVRILKYGNTETLEGYQNIKLFQFWSMHKDRIKQKLFIELKDNPEYDVARKLIKINEMSINIEKQIPIFIDMLNKGNTNILKTENTETLEGYPSIKLSYFWNSHQDKIKQKLFVDLKDNPEYDVARKLIETNEISLSVEKQIPIFINMLNKGNVRILKYGNTETLEGYPSIKLTRFWNSHQDRIKQKLLIELKDNTEYEVARKLIEINEVSLNVEKQIPIFIDMLNKGNVNILKTENKETLEGYPSIKLSNFWNRHQDRIKRKLFIDLKGNPKYDVARKLIAIKEISLSVEKQISIFIDMLNKGNDKILKTENKETLEGYTSIKLSYFWQNNKDRIKQKLFIELKDNPEYDSARKLIEINEMSLSVEKQIPIFINMLNKGNVRILKYGTKETLEGYPSIKLSHFWQNNKHKIKQKLFIELKDNPEYDVARKLIEINEISLSVEKQIPIFIDMLNKGNTNILKARNKETLEGYPNINLSQFWNMHKDRIKQKLFVDLKDNPEYDIARKLIKINEMSINIEKQIPIFINMLNKGNDKILKKGNTETLEGYTSIKLSYFWNSHQDKIKQKLFVDLKDNPEYDVARKLIETNEISLSVEKQIPIFINMLNKGNTNILKTENKETLEGYPSIKLSRFWNSHQDRIKQKLFIELKDNPEYEVARKLIETNEMSINIEKQIPIFINMLNKGNDNILKTRNTETLEGYSNIKLGYFWSEHQDKIKQKLFIELKDNPEYDAARRIIEINEMTIKVEKQIPIFINMLNKGNGNILKQGNKETLEGYPNIKLAIFWSKYHNRIKPKLFIELKDNQKYNIARQTVLTYFKVSSYEELEAKQNKGKKLQELEKMQQELDEAIKYIDKVDLTEQEQRKRA